MKALSKRPYSCQKIFIKKLNSDLMDKLQDKYLDDDVCNFLSQLVNLNNLENESLKKC